MLIIRERRGDRPGKDQDRASEDSTPRPEAGGSSSGFAGRQTARADARKSKDELIEEIESLRRRLGESERMEEGERKGLLDPLTERLQQVYREAPTGLCYFDRNLRYVFINNCLAGLNGISVEEHLGRSIREVIPDVAAGVEAQLRHVIETGEPIIEGEVDAETPAHPELIRSFQHYYYAIKSEAGTVLGVACVVQEVTARKQAEEALRESEERLKLITNAVPAGISYFDREQRFRFANEKYEWLLGLKSSELVGKTLEEAIGKEPYKVARQYVQRALSGQTASFENTLPAKNGGKISIAVSYVPDIGSDRTVKGFFALVQDVTERKRAEAALQKAHDELESRVEERTRELRDANRALNREIAERKQAENRFRNLLEAAPDPIVTVDKDGKIVMVNTQTERVLGYGRDEAIGQGVELFLPERLHGRHVKNRREYLRHPRTRSMGSGIELVARCKDGRELPVEVSLSPAKLSEGGVVIASIRDITQRRRTEEALRNNKERLRLLLETTSAIPWEADVKTWLFTYVGPQAVKLLGYLGLPARCEWTGHVRNSLVMNEFITKPQVQ